MLGKRKLIMILAAVFALAAFSACTITRIDGGKTSGSVGDNSAHTHTFAAEWSDDEDNHWHAATCAHADEKSDLGAHTFIKDNTKNDTENPKACISGAKNYFVCSICGRTKSEVLPTFGHVLIKIDEKAATATAPGNTAYWHCEACDKCFKDDAAETEIDYEELLTPIINADFTITYDENGKGSATDLSGVGSIPKEMPILFEDGYVFEGWFTDEDLTKPVKTGIAIFNDVTLYAKWSIDNAVMSDYIQALLDATTGYRPAWNKESFKDKWNYIDGVFLNSVVSLYYSYIETDAAKAEAYKDFFIKYVNYYVDANGNFVSPGGSSGGFAGGELDSICESKILFDAYALTGDARYIKAADTTYTKLMGINIVSGTTNFNHKNSGYANQIWLDGLYMYAPFYARYAISQNDSTIFNKLRVQYQCVREHMFDQTQKLYYHGYDSTKSIFWANSETGCSASFWLRGEGWLLMSLADVIEYFPEGADKAYLTDMLSEALIGILPYMDKESKMLYQVIDAVDENGLPLSSDGYTNFLESSGSSMVAYAVMKAARLGYIDKSYRASGAAIFEGVYAHSFNAKTNALEDVCITAGLGPSTNKSRDGSLKYYFSTEVGSNDAKGVGPFITAFLEYAFGENQAAAVTPEFIELTVSFNAQGGSIIADKTIYKGQKITAPRPIKSGYTFDGWYNESGTQKFDFALAITESTTLYAKWTEGSSAANTPIYSENFESYNAGDKLDTEASLSAAYANLNTANNYVQIVENVIEGKSAKLYDKSSSATILTLPTELSGGKYKIELDVLPNSSNTNVAKWCLVTLEGTNAAVRTDNTTSGGTAYISAAVVSGSDYAYTHGETRYQNGTVFHIEITLDYASNTFDVVVNDETVAAAIGFDGAAVSGLSFITARADTARTITVDNIAVYQLS